MQSNAQEQLKRGWLMMGAEHRHMSGHRTLQQCFKPITPLPTHLNLF